MHITRISMMSAAALAAGLALTACGANASTTGATGSSPSTTISSGSTPSGTTTTSGSTGGTASTGGSTGSGGTGTTVALTNACHTANLGFSTGHDSGAQVVGSPGAVTIVLTNKGSASCDLRGYPGVDLVASNGNRWPLQRKTASVSTVTLAPGATAAFVIDYMPYSSGSGMEFKAKSMLITPPNETHSYSMTWGYQSVLDQSGATHPVTYVEPTTTYSS
ncbi:hypothetical protein ABIA33_006804 [Streptacidiphilus sp. MAP12-16]|uniref:DUF4232 domain-containing protein n=1 Tax=Streptacidiphilus sp. MAP12-16 TaxID=3156300 RepID=UPI0035196884